MLKKILTAVLCTFMLLCTVAFAAAELNAGDTAYVVYGGTVNVTKNPTYSGGISEISKGAKVTVLEPDMSLLIHRLGKQHRYLKPARLPKRS